MNIFFYAPLQTTEAGVTFDWLCALDPPLNIKQLPSGLAFVSHAALQMRSGDLIVLFARNAQELEPLLQQRLAFTNFRIVLILQKNDQNLVEKGIRLYSRYTTSVEQNYCHIHETIRKILN